MYPLKLKSDVLETFIKFHQRVERQFNLKIQSFQSDWGGEFHHVSKYLKDFVIHHWLSCPHTPAQNGTAERKRRHVIETALSLMKQASMPHKFWDEAACTMVYLINRMPTPILKYQSMYCLLFSQEPDYSFLHNFGCACYPYLRHYAMSKLDSRSERCVFLGYSAFHHGYRCLSMSSGRIFISRDVVFTETHYPFADNLHVPSSSQESIISVRGILGSSPLEVPLQPPTLAPLDSPHMHTDSANSSSPPSNTVPSSTSFPSHSPPPDLSSCESPLSTPTPGHIPSTNPLSSSNLDHLTSPSHTRTKSLSAVIQSLDHPTSPSHPRYPLPQCYSTTSEPISEPMNYTSASKQSHWVQAMKDEYSALIRNHTWLLVPRPSTRPVIGCKWVYKTKLSSHGRVDRFKARLVAKGFHQEGRIDYHDTFSPVIKVTTIRLLLSLAISKNWHIRQLDISNAFLHGDLTELIYMEHHQGLKNPAFPNHVCQLRKSLYGLKQAPREWFHKLTSQLLRFGFTGSKTDTSLFYLHTGPIYILIYVDDILILGPSSSKIDALVKSLSEHFTLRDLGTASNFLGVEFRPCTDGYFLTQSHYTAYILKKLHLDLCKPLATPIPIGTPISKSNSYHNPALYRSIVGTLQYLNMTCPDIAFAVNHACRSIHSPQSADWVRLKHLLRYLKGTIDYGLHIKQDSDPSLTAYSDADWAGNCLDRCFTAGFLVYLGGNLISWSSKKQPTVARSSMEAEYKAIANAASELIWITSLLRELRISLPAPILWCDNIGATCLSANPVFHAQMKHIEIDFHFVREQVAARQLRVCVISSQDQIADLLTKALPKQRFQLLRSKLNILPAFHLRGGVKA